MSSTTTKKMISASLIQLAESKNIDTITVKDIVAHCGITRQTFYYHFQDIMDLFEWTINLKMEELLLESKPTDTLDTAIQRFIQSTVDGRKIINKLLSSRSRQRVEEMLVSSMRTYLLELADAKGLFRDIPRGDMDFALNFYAYAIVGSMFELCRKKDALIDRDNLTAMIVRLLTGVYAIKE